MTLKRATRAAQWPLTSEFTFEPANDSVVDINGVTKALNVFGTAIVFDAINLPAGAVVVGGEVVTEVAGAGSTAFTTIVGDSDTANRYMASTDKVAAGRTALTLTGYVGQGENVRVSFLPTVANATAGKITIRVAFIIRGKGNEVIPN
jgi:hypothetical protein